MNWEDDEEEEDEAEAEVEAMGRESKNSTLNDVRSETRN